jgi:hypothetical protein
MYGSETWVKTKKTENIINSYERKILRGYLDPSTIMEPRESDTTKKYTLYMETQNYQQLYN